MLDKSQRKLLLFPAAGVVVGAAAAVLMFPVASVAGMAAIGVAGAAVGGVVLPVVSLALFAIGAGLKKFVANDGQKIAALGLMVGLASAKALFVTPVQTVGKKIKSLFSKKKGQQPPSVAVHHEAEAPSLTNKIVQDGFNKAGQPAQQKLPEEKPSVSKPKPPSL